MSWHIQAKDGESRSEMSSTENVSTLECSTAKATKLDDSNQQHHQQKNNASTMQNLSIPKALYRRPLPESCIPFASEEGRTVFTEALATGHMNCYFPLASQFRTQDEPAYCGLSSLVMVLNAFEIDPGRIWKGPWKWYSENMLDCCMSTEIVRKQGITFEEFICLAECNSLVAEGARVDAFSSKEIFRELVKSLSLKEDSFLVLSYSRATLNQTGDGHFAPMSGYHPGRDLILILDTARFKYPPHWVPLSLLFESMKALDKSTGLPRGYIKLWPANDIKTLLLFKISEEFGVNASPENMKNYQEFMSAWIQMISTPISLDKVIDPITAIVTRVLQGLVNLSSALKKTVIVLTTQEHIKCSDCCKMQNVILNMLSQVENTSIFKAVCKRVISMPVHDVQYLQGLFGIWTSVDGVVMTSLKEAQEALEKKTSNQQPQCCDMNKKMCLCHILTGFLLSWPHTCFSGPSTLGSVLYGLAQDDLDDPDRHLLKDEMTVCTRQFKRLINYHSTDKQINDGKRHCSFGQPD